MRGLRAGAVHDAQLFAGGERAPADDELDPARSVARLQRHAVRAALTGRVAGRLGHARLRRAPVPRLGERDADEAADRDAARSGRVVDRPAPAAGDRDARGTGGIERRASATVSRMARLVAHPAERVEDLAARRRRVAGLARGIRLLDLARGRRGVLVDVLPVVLLRALAAR